MRLALRLVAPDDAGFVHALRTDPALSAHLSPVTGSIADQRRWIEAYKTREAEGREAYYVIERRDDGAPCGLVRLYELTADRFTWGSWMLAANKPPKAALESAVLSFGIGFGALGKSEALIDVRRDNARALAFYRRFGMIETGADEIDIFFRYQRERFEADRPRHMRTLQECIEP